MEQAETKIRPTDLARATGITIQFASQLLRGERSPSLKMAKVIEKETGIPVSSWPRPNVKDI